MAFEASPIETLQQLAAAMRSRHSRELVPSIVRDSSPFPIKWLEHMNMTYDISVSVALTFCAGGGKAI